MDAIQNDNDQNSIGGWICQQVFGSGLKHSEEVYQAPGEVTVSDLLLSWDVNRVYHAGFNYFFESSSIDKHESCDRQFTAMHVAAYLGDAQLFEQLLDQGADVGALMRVKRMQDHRHEDSLGRKFSTDEYYESEKSHSLQEIIQWPSTNDNVLAGREQIAQRLSGLFPVDAAEEKEEGGYDGGDEQPTRPCRQRLVIGDGNMSYSRALLEKHRDNHPGLPPSVTVTEYASESSLTQGSLASSDEEEGEFCSFNANVRAIRDMGATVTFNVDAAALGDHFGGRRFPRVHFNFPYVGVTRAMREESERRNEGGVWVTMQRENRALVNNFFANVGQLQELGDRVHMALPKLPDDASKEAWHQETTYAIRQAAIDNSYRLLTKRQFCDRGVSARYPGYFHVRTGRTNSTDTAETGREYIFEKVASPEEALRLSSIVTVPNSFSGRPWQVLSCQTDDESSTYEVSDNDAAIVPGSPG